MGKVVDMVKKRERERMVNGEWGEREKKGIREGQGFNLQLTDRAYLDHFPQCTTRQIFQTY